MDNNQDNNNVEKVQNEPSNALDENVNFLYMLTSNRLQNQLQQIDSLDSKTISLLGFSCTLMAILAAAITIIEITGSEILMAYAALGISFSAFIFIAIVSLKSYFVKDWHVGPNIQEAWEHSKKYAQHAMLEWAADSFTEGYNTNSVPVKNKIFAIKKVSIALIIQIIFLILAVILVYLY